MQHHLLAKVATNVTDQVVVVLSTLTTTSRIKKAETL
jgi:hypothetical protein